MKIILSGGGTGGHITPALAIADALVRADKDMKILFVGSKKGMENTLVPNGGYPIWSIDSAGYKRGKGLENIKTVVKNIKAMGEADKIIEKFRPDGVIGTGGYVCFPIIYRASKKGIYTALHESNAVAGLAVKLLSSRGDRIFLNFVECENSIKDKEKILQYGNPLRNAIGVSSRSEARKELLGSSGCRKLILSFGGSLGAQAINESALEIMKEISSKNRWVKHIHASGKQGYNEFYKKFCERGFDQCPNIELKEYIYDMPKIMQAADVVISRCGAMTLSEIAAAGRASVLIPSPNVTDDHQFKNAMAFSNGGAAFVVSEHNGDEMGKIPQYVETLLTDDALRASMEANAKKFDYPGAADAIAARIIKEIRNKAL